MQFPNMKDYLKIELIILSRFEVGIIYVKWGFEYHYTISPPVEGVEKWEVEKILNKKIVREVVKYLV